MSGDYSIGSQRWPGLAKIIEEASELTTVAGKLIATGGQVEYWDGAPLNKRLEEEIADLEAALMFFLINNPQISQLAIQERKKIKLARFMGWQEAEDPSPNKAL
jgi:hypothetical protein